MQNYNFVKNDVFVAKICKYALYESSEGFFCAPRKAANFCHPARKTMDGWMDVHFGSWAITLSRNYSLASNPSTKPLRATLQAE